MFGAPLIALVLATPSEVFEEWSLTPSAPLSEVVTARALYHRRDGAVALLPASLRRGTRPEVHALGVTRALAVTWGARGWQCALPPGERASVRLIARVVRTPSLPRTFRVRWPEVVSDGAPTRRVAIVPREWLEGSPRGWTCPEEPEGEVPCVSHERAPGPLVFRVSAPPSPRGASMLAFVLSGASLALAGWSPSRRVERVVAALGGAAVALSVCLSVVGAHASSWGESASALVPIGMLAGAVAPRARWSRVLGAAALVVVPMLAVAGASAPWVLGVAALLAAAVMGAAASGAR